MSRKTGAHDVAGGFCEVRMESSAAEGGRKGIGDDLQNIDQVLIC
jgi:hypothetical protein